MSALSKTLNDYIVNNALTDAINTLIVKPHLISEIDHATFWQKCLTSTFPNVIINSTHLLSIIRKHYSSNQYLPSFLSFNYDEPALYETPQNKKKICDALLICFNNHYGPIIYQNILDHITLLQNLYEKVIDKDLEEQIKYQQILDKYDAVFGQKKKLLEILLEEINFDEKFIFADNLKLRLLFNQVFHFMVAGRSGLGKSTLIRKLFEDFVDEDDLPKASDGERGIEEPLTVKTVLKRKIKEDEKPYQNLIFNNDIEQIIEEEIDQTVYNSIRGSVKETVKKNLTESAHRRENNHSFAASSSNIELQPFNQTSNSAEISLTIMATDIGGFGANITDKEASEHESELIKLVNQTILKSFMDKVPVNLLIYFVDDRILVEDLILIQHCSYVVPVIVVKSKSPEVPTEKYMRTIEKYNFNKNVFYLYPIVAKASIGLNVDNMPIKTPESGLNTLMKIMSKVYYNNDFREHYISYYIGHESPEYSKYLKERTTRALKSVAATAASSAIITGLFPPLMDAFIFGLCTNSMIGIINLIYGVPVNLNVVKILYAICKKAPFSSVGTVGVLAIGDFLKLTGFGYLVGAAINGSVTFGAMLAIGYSLVETYNSFCLIDGNDIHDITEEYILTNIQKYYSLTQQKNKDFEEFKNNVKKIERGEEVE